MHFQKILTRRSILFAEQRRDTQTRVRRKDNNLFGVFFRQRVNLSHSFIVVILFSSSQKQGREKERVLRESFLLERERSLTRICISLVSAFSFLRYIEYTVSSLRGEQREEQNREKTLNAFVVSRWLVRGERERKKQS